MEAIKHIDVASRLVYGEKPIIEMQLTTVFTDDSTEVGPLVVVTDEDAAQLALAFALARISGRQVEVPA